MLNIPKPSFLTLYQIISATFCVLVVMSNIISTKMIKLPFLDNFSVPAGLLLYPLTFLIADLVTEIYGLQKAKLMVYIGLGMNFLSFCMIQLVLLLPSSFEGQTAFHSVLGFSGWRILSSLIAYIIAQLVDIQLYSLIKNWTGSRFLWLRNNGSTCLSQIVDTLIVDILYFYWGLAMPFHEVMMIMLFSYTYKTAFSIANTPLFYLSVFIVKKNWQLQPLTRAI